MGSYTLKEEELLELVRKAQEGETDAFGTIYEEFFDSVYRYAAFRLPKELAEDAVADIFVKAWEKLHTYKIRKNVPFGAWLFRIARHTVIDLYRTHRGFDEVPDNLVDPDALNRADSRLKRHDLLRIVRTALDQLPRRYREVLVLSFLSELPNRSIAKVLRITEGGVRILKLRALRKLEAHLPSDLQDNPPENV